jgi:MYXO-CTERM domain-containing protein
MKTMKQIVKVAALVAALSAPSAFAQSGSFTIPVACFVQSVGAQSVSWLALLPLAGLAGLVFLRRKNQP